MSRVLRHAAPELQLTANSQTGTRNAPPVETRDDSLWDLLLGAGGTASVSGPTVSPQSAPNVSTV
jgi:hypothetical protein